MTAMRAILSGCLAITAFPGVADSFCARLDALSPVQPALMLPPALSDQAGVCQTSRALSGSVHVHCRWSFVYRSDAATALFEGLFETVATCLGPDAVITTDQSVNHPDAYDLRMFDIAGRTFAVSLKDKGALQQTLVFVRVQQR